MCHVLFSALKILQTTKRLKEEKEKERKERKKEKKKNRFLTKLTFWDSLTIN